MSTLESSRIHRATLACLWVSLHVTGAFSFVRTKSTCFIPSGVSPRQSSRIYIYAPPGSGYFTRDDEESELPDSYDPMMEYPGTMRPGRTPENMPFHDLPIADTDPDPVPWPHFQEIEWHHRWDPPHPHPIPMEEFIEQEGRWATPEMEAAMRAGNRRDARQRRELEEQEKRQTLIMDDDDDDQDEPQNLGDGMFGQLGSAADQAITAAAVAPRAIDDDEDDEEEEEESGDDDDDDGGLDDFLLDLGLDSSDDNDEDDAGDGNNDIKPATKKERAPAPPKASATAGLEDVIISEDDEDETEDVSPSADVTASIDVDDDDDLDLGLDEEDEMTDDGVSTVPLEDFSDNEGLDTENFFNDGGFDYDAGDGFDGGDDFY